MGVLGGGNYEYELVPDWAKLPSDLILGDLYVGDVVDADWDAVMCNKTKPVQPRRFQKLQKLDQE